MTPVQSRKIGSVKRPAFNRHEMQARAAVRIVAPGLPGRQKIDAHAEPGLDNGERARAGPARRAIVAAADTRGARARTPSAPADRCRGGTHGAPGPPPSRRYGKPRRTAARMDYRSHRRRASPA